MPLPNLVKLKAKIRSGMLMLNEMETVRELVL
jgi:hypothetical protein